MHSLDNLATTGAIRLFSGRSAGVMQRKNGGVERDAVQVFVAILCVATLAAIALTIAAMFLRRRSVAASAVLDTVVDLGPWCVFTVTAGSMAGSLYFSEVANFTPCALCWYQRIAMYSLAIISLVAGIRRDRSLAPYYIVLATLGLCVSTYHYVLEWFPTLESNVCSVDVPCTTIWFREFGFITLPFMAASAFLATIVWSALTMRPIATTDHGTKHEGNQ